MPRIFHIATAADWEAAQRSGAYTTSTRGRTLAAEGFIHASRGDQWPRVREQFYADVTEPLVLLVIDTARLDVPVVDEEVPGGETFPHLYGPLSPDAVVRAVPLEVALAGSTRSFSSIFLAEVFHSALLGTLLIGCTLVGVVAGRAVDDTWGAWLGLVLGVGAGCLLTAWLHRRRSRPPLAGTSTP